MADLTITRAVGATVRGVKAPNLPDDMEKVKTLLNRIPGSEGGTRENPLNSRDPSTVGDEFQRLIDNIANFQLAQDLFHGRSDGRVDPDEITIKTLNRLANQFFEKPQGEPNLKPPLPPKPRLNKNGKEVIDIDSLFGLLKPSQWKIVNSAGLSGAVKLPVGLAAGALDLHRDGTPDNDTPTISIGSISFGEGPIPVTVEFSTRQLVNLGSRLLCANGFPTDFELDDIVGPVLILSLSGVVVGGANLTIVRFGSNPGALKRIFTDRAKSGLPGELANFVSALFLTFPGVIGGVVGGSLGVSIGISVGIGAAIRAKK